MGLAKDGSMRVDEALKRRGESLTQVEEIEIYEERKNSREDGDSQ